jgi:hypothetical protein
MQNEARISETDATAIATLLGPWAVIPEEPDSYDHARRATLDYTGPDPLLRGARLYLHAGSYGHQGKLHCSGSLHVQQGTESLYLGNYLSRDERNAMATSINVSLTKSPAQMAKDLQRRLLPSYLQGFAHGRQALTAQADKQASQHAVASALAALMPGADLRPAARLGDESTIYRPGCPTLRVAAGYVRAEHISMSHAQARLLVALLASSAWQTATA